MPSKPIVFTLIAVVAVVCSCAGKRDYSSMSAEQMYAEASALAAEEKGFFSRNNKEVPLEMLNEIQIRHAFSPYASLAALKIADIHFNSGKYKTASDQYRQFVADNPKHAKREQAMYGIAESFYRVREGHKRDQSPCRQTVFWSQTYLSIYPESQRKDEVQGKIDTCRGIMAQSELEIGRFYLKRKHYEAARRRFSHLIDNFPDTEAARLSQDLLASLPPEEENDK